MELTEIEVVIPQYIQEYKLSNARMRTFFKEGSHIGAKGLPKKYLDNPRFFFKKGKLWDAEKKDFVTKNPQKAGKPRYKAISANNVWAKMHEFERKKMIEQIKQDFRPHFEPHREAFKNLKFPVLVECDLYTFPKYADWDLSNLWVYNKVLEDLIKADSPDELEYLTERNPDRIPGMGLIPDDCISYITKPATPRFIPISQEEDRRMVYRFITDTDPRVTSHLMYNLHPKEPAYISAEETGSLMWFVFTKEGATGNYVMNMDEGKITANVGIKKVIAGEVSTALNRLYWDCINMNRGVAMWEEQYTNFESFISKFLLQKGIPVYVCRIPKI